MATSWGWIGKVSGGTGEVAVDGVGSKWEMCVIFVGAGLLGGSSGTLNITGGGAVSAESGKIGAKPDGTGEVTVDGSGSAWTNATSLTVGDEGSGALNITGGGLVSTETLVLDSDADGNGFINMATGGMLALLGDADDSLADFMGLIDGTDAIRYWDDSYWSNLTNADACVKSLPRRRC